MTNDDDEFFNDKSISTLYINRIGINTLTPPVTTLVFLPWLPDRNYYIVTRLTNPLGSPMYECSVGYQMKAGQTGKPDQGYGRSKELAKMSWQTKEVEEDILIRSLESVKNI